MFDFSAYRLGIKFEMRCDMLLLRFFITVEDEIVVEGGKVSQQ